MFSVESSPPTLVRKRRPGGSLVPVKVSYKEIGGGWETANPVQRHRVLRQMTTTTHDSTRIGRGSCSLFHRGGPNLTSSDGAGRRMSVLSLSEIFISLASSTGFTTEGGGGREALGHITVSNLRMKDVCNLSS